MNVFDLKHNMTPSRKDGDSTEFSALDGVADPFFLGLTILKKFFGVVLFTNTGANEYMTAIPIGLDIDDNVFAIALSLSANQSRNPASIRRSQQNVPNEANEVEVSTSRMYPSRADVVYECIAVPIEKL
ncbi:hypothetical protein GCK72_025649 [Caenorhabditis remanei]|uniref:Uncharacterized protein n=1 Tax=Caenorhabditis remanei TaxID=31234 RepID=A0A6A5G3A6_CAERE|nr:hypothetical protein GCK72_025649 [Caenorhabditis remanei]KAF1749182.1 hypothetical protein GCK72_025649 [Caenorhabditis remanei]